MSTHPRLQLLLEWRWFLPKLSPSLPQWSPSLPPRSPSLPQPSPSLPQLSLAPPHLPTGHAPRASRRLLVWADAVRDHARAYFPWRHVADGRGDRSFVGHAPAPRASPRACRRGSPHPRLLGESGRRAASDGDCRGGTVRDPRDSRGVERGGRGRAARNRIVGGFLIISYKPLGSRS